MPKISKNNCVIFITFYVLALSPRDLTRANVIGEIMSTGIFTLTFANANQEYSRAIFWY